jgi:peptide/nickel transport system permease protein
VRRRHPAFAALAGIAIFAFVAGVALFADAIAPAAPEVQRLAERLDPPSWLGGEHGYALGTDQLGRDMLSRLIYGSRVSLAVGVIGTALSGSFGAALGLLAGYFGGICDRVIMRATEIQQAIPPLVLAIAVVAVLRPSVVNLILVLAVTSWVTFARVVRGEVLALRETPFVEAARMVGSGHMRIVTRHIVPNVAPTIVVLASVTVANLILFEASLSFLGLGVPPPTPTWGRMAYEGVEYLSTAWWIPLLPGGAVLLTVLGSNLVGDRLRDALDPRRRRQ